jgi:threonine aldolase
MPPPGAARSLGLVPERFLVMSSAPTRRPASVLPKLLGRLAAEETDDDAVPRLESRVADLLGKPAAVMFPTGTMAQQVAMRIHADRRGVRTIAFHPQCHLNVHEHNGYATVHGLVAALVGDRFSVIELSDLAEVSEPVAALLLELPQRDLGGQLPTWDELVAQTEWAHDRGAAAHMDGARLWEAQPFYGRPHAEIAAQFDSVYVSLYKGLMGISGAILAGQQDFVDHARVWRDRLGGDMSRCWPLAMSGERGLDELLPRMPEFAERARKLAALLGELPGVHVVPDPPQTPMFHLYLEASPNAVVDACRELREVSALAPPRRVFRHRCLGWPFSSSPCPNSSMRPPMRKSVISLPS